MVLATQAHISPSGCSRVPSTLTQSAKIRPLIGIPAGYRAYDSFHVHVVGDRNILAVIEAADATPLIVPAVGEQLNITETLAGLDGVMLTGGASNIEPDLYGGAPSRNGDLHEPMRDATTLPLTRAALDSGVPVFAMCRGMQELNVALGGTLHQYLHEVPGRFDHRRDRTKPFEAQTAPIHHITITPGGVLEGVTGMAETMVNSLHGQGVDQPAPGTTVEAVADDSTIEGISVNGARAFALGIQWHAEFAATSDPVSIALFAAFGDAARERAKRRGLG